jgi:transposase-like protein
VEAILITVTDNLNGFTDTIKSVFSKSTTQICVGYQIRDYCRYVVWKEKKEFSADLKNIYNATKQAAGVELDRFEQKWRTKYFYAIRYWRTNWDNLTAFFDFPVEIRKIIYTTNLIENMNGKIRKYTKNKLSFPADYALKSSVYLAITEIEKKWYMPIWNWGMAFNQELTPD